MKISSWVDFQFSWVWWLSTMIISHFQNENTQHPHYIEKCLWKPLTQSWKLRSLSPLGVDIYITKSFSFYTEYFALRYSPDVDDKLISFDAKSECNFNFIENRGAMIPVCHWWRLGLSLSLPRAPSATTNLILWKLFGFNAHERGKLRINAKPKLLSTG